MPVFKHSRYIFWFCCLLASALSAGAQAPDTPAVDKVLQLAREQYGAYIRQYPDSNLHPYSIRKDGTMQAVTYHDWTSGFFPGALWYLYRFNGDEKWKYDAIKWTSTLAPAQWLTDKHDLGFILNTSFGNGYRITGDSSFKNILHRAALSLCTRFSPVTGSIKSWDNGPWHYPVIVDNLMNLELLFQAAEIFRDTSFLHIAVSHLANEVKYRFRADGSTYHVLDFDPATGQLIARKTWQGLSDSSCWARGQAWAIYGFTMAYRYTHTKIYLEQAIKAAGYFIRQVSGIPDGIPYWDFNDPAIPGALKDASSAAVAASALLELAGYVPSAHSLYRGTASRILQSLCTKEYLAEAGTNHFFMLKHSVVNKPSGKGVDVPVIYADYYFLEALWRYRTGKVSMGGDTPEAGVFQAGVHGGLHSR